MKKIYWEDFILNFKQFVYETEKIEMKDNHIEKIRVLLDKNFDQFISFKKWEHFFIFYWSYYERKMEILKIRRKNNNR